MVHVPRLMFQESSQSEGEGSGLEEGQLEETYVEWLVRSTGVVEERREEAGVEDWVAAQRRRYWRWAGHVARCNDGRWTQKLMKWTPQHGYRHRGHPLKRWTDDLDAFFAAWGFEKGGWTTVAQQRLLWRNIENDFIYGQELEME